MRLPAQIGFILFAVVTATITEAQNTPSPQQPRQLLHGDAPATKPSAAITPQAEAPSPVPQVASSLLDQPASPAQVQLDAGKLSVKADNSTLSGILHDISSKTGMTVDGLSRDQRIFGTYGPAAPREVLSSRLDGLGYNVMMVGSLSNGAPRLVTLAPRTGGGAAASGNRATPMARQSNSNNDDEDDSGSEPQDNPLPPRPETQPETNQPPDQQQPPANPNQQGQPGQVKTPQQMLQELQQMRQQQLQQNNPQ
jgi:hypothetical protein